MALLDRIVRAHPWGVLAVSSVVAAAASLARDVAGQGHTGRMSGWEVAWLAVTVVAGLVSLYAVYRLAREHRPPHLPRHGPRAT